MRYVPSASRLFATLVLSGTLLGCTKVAPEVFGLESGFGGLSAPVIGPPSLDAINSAKNVSFVIDYPSDAAIQLTDAHVEVFSSSGVGCAAPVITTTGASRRTVTLGSCNGEGSVWIRITSGSATGSDGELEASDASETVAVDNTAPTGVSWLSPTGTMWGAMSGYYFKWNMATDNQALMPLPYKVELFDNSNCTAPAAHTTSVAATEYNWNFFGEVGSKTARITAFDAAGNSFSPGCSSTLNVQAASKGLFMSKQCLLPTDDTTLPGSTSETACSHGIGKALWMSGLNSGSHSADGLCRRWAKDAGLGNHDRYVAWASAEGNDAYCRVHGHSSTRDANCGQAALPNSAGPWALVNTGGKTLEASNLATDIADLTSCTPQAGYGGSTTCLPQTVNRTEYGSSIGAGTHYALTNTFADGRAAGNDDDCFFSLGGFCAVGKAARSSSWTAYASMPLAESGDFYLYCIEK